MEKDLEKDIKNLTEQRCMKALQSNSEYMELQKKCAEAYVNKQYDEYSDLVASLLAVAVSTCYRAGAIDIVHILYTK